MTVTAVSASASSCTTTIDRFDFGVNFDSKLPGGQPVAGNDVTLHIELELIKPAA
jgi:polyisoprenoid-binding protein YceI